MATWDTVVRIGLDLPDVAVDQWFGTPALFETSHYEGYGAMLVRLDDATDELITDILEDAWRQKAPATLIKRLDTTS